MRRHAALLLGALAVAGAARADVLSAGARGTTTADFLELGVGARAIALGQAYTAAADEATAVYWNPADLTLVSGRSATLMHALYLDSSFFDYAGYAQNLGAAGAVGLGLQYFSAGSIGETDAAGSDAGTFNPYDLAVTASYARTLEGFDFMDDLNGLSIGVSAKYIQSRIIASAQTAAADVGFLSKPYLDGRLRASLVIANMGGQLKYEQQSDPLPLAFTAGTAFQASKSLLFTFDARFPRDDRANAGVGSEYVVAKDGPWSLAGRLGFNTQTVGSIDGLTGLAIGFGVGFGKGSVDYAFVPLGGLGQAHRLSLTYGF